MFSPWFPFFSASLYSPLGVFSTLWSCLQGPSSLEERCKVVQALSILLGPQTGGSGAAGTYSLTSSGFFIVEHLHGEEMFPLR